MDCLRLLGREGESVWEVVDLRRLRDLEVDVGFWAALSDLSGRALELGQGAGGDAEREGRAVLVAVGSLSDSASASESLGSEEG